MSVSWEWKMVTILTVSWSRSEDIRDSLYTFVVCLSILLGGLSLSRCVGDVILRFDQGRFVASDVEARIRKGGDKSTKIGEIMCMIRI